MDFKEKRIDTIAVAIGVIMVLYHLVACYYNIFGSVQHRIVHLLFGLILIFFRSAFAGKSGKKLISVILLFASIYVCMYLWINMERLIQYEGFPKRIDVYVAILTLIAVLTACYFTIGLVICAVVICIFIYAFFGYHIGAAFLTVDEIMTTAVLGFGSFNMFGSILNISANTIFLYVVFGGLLQALRGTDFIFELGKGLGKISRSGPAATAIFGSALMGMTTGQTTSNIAVTGSFTIPLMKKAGYKPEVAGAIEAAASGGGQITPPIMGAGAFVMADLLGIPYTDVLKMAILPAAFYYISMLIFVHLQALKSKIVPPVEEMDVKRVIATAPLFIIPIATILVILFMGYPPGVGAFWGIVAVVVLSYLRKDTRPTLHQLFDGCYQGAKIGATLAASVASIGPAIALMTKTGLGLTIGYSVERWAFGSPFMGLIILMAATIVLGMELPTVAAYLIAAVIAVPPLVAMGLNIYGAHMFAYYFSSFSALTPPIGMAAVVASRLANAKYLRTAYHAIVAAGAGYLLPYLFVYDEQLILRNVKPLDFVFLLALIVLGLLAIQMGLVGYFVNKLKPLGVLLSLISGIGIFSFIVIHSNLPVLIVSIVILACVMGFELLKKRNRNSAAKEMVSA